MHGHVRSMLQCCDRVATANQKMLDLGQPLNIKREEVRDHIHLTGGEVRRGRKERLGRERERPRWEPWQQQFLSKQVLGGRSPACVECSVWTLFELTPFRSSTSISHITLKQQHEFIHFWFSFNSFISFIHFIFYFFFVSLNQSL